MDSEVEHKRKEWTCLLPSLQCSASHLLILCSGLCVSTDHHILFTQINEN